MIDIHLHIQDEEHLKALEKGLKFTKDYFKIDLKPVPLEETIKEMDEAGVEKAVILPGAGDTRYHYGGWVSNDHIAGIVKKYPDRFIPFATADPHLGEHAISELERAIKELGFKGLKFHPAAQDFWVDDRVMVYPIYEKCIELDIPVLTHTGNTGLGACKIEKLKPVLLDNVAQDFPDLKIIAAHGGWPWTDELLAVAMHNPNVYIDLSGWSPKYLSPNLYTYTKNFLRDRVLFGTDYPMIKFSRWLKDFDEVCKKFEIDGDLKKKILGENAKRLLKIK